MICDIIVLSIFNCIFRSPAMTRDPSPPSKPPEIKAPARYSSEQLLGSARQIEIVHGGQVYLLQVTRQGKLILTK
jgi:hemin uptake protein HemP